MNRNPLSCPNPRSRYLNLGCGSRFHLGWENVDMYPYGPGVRVHDLTKRTPYDDETFDVVYHSHVLEHFPRRQALSFLQECRRILKSGGVVRVVVPDLERITRLYIESLEKASTDVPGWADNYEWMVIEMYDQAVREETCGALTEYFKRDPLPNWDFVSGRMGAYGDSSRKTLVDMVQRSKTVASRPKLAWGYLFRNAGKVFRNKLLKFLLKEQGWEALQVGQFRRGGEVHMWMYDRYSLAKLLHFVGFIQVQQVGPAESRIPDWPAFCLDTEPDGRTYKADSMYMEASKP